MRVVLTTSSSWYGSAGGVAYTNSFTWGDNTPCFVFTALLGYNLKNISEAASHEIGHTLGLNHQSAYDAICNKTSEYNQGTGSGEIGWAPIMGVGYYRNVTLWHYGSNPFGCSYMQDDLGIIAGTTNGFGYRTDDHGNTTGTATNAIFTNNRFAFDGIIERPNDMDMVRVNVTQGGRVQATALPYSVGAGNIGANVDLQMELTNSAGTVLGVYNPATELSASLDTTLPAGVYFLRVSSKGNSYAPDFATLGSYSVEVSMKSITLPVHKLELKAVAQNNRHRLNWEIVADERVVVQTVEIAADGLRFEDLTGVNAGSRTFTHAPAKAGSVAYRMRILFDNGRTYYSNTVTLRSSENPSPQMVGNTVSSGIAVNAPAPFQYAIYDMNGRQVARGQLNKGINQLTPPVAQGMYVIAYSSNGEQYSEKFRRM
jgi:hypothetical protein